MIAPYKLEPGEMPPNGVAEGNKSMASDWHVIWNIGHHAGYDKAELERADEIIRLKRQVEVWRGWVFVSGIVWLCTALVAVSIILK